MDSARRPVAQLTSSASTTPVPVWLSLLRHHLRLLAPSSIAWIIGLLATSMLVVGAYADTFPTEQERLALAASIEGNPAFEAMFGRAYALHTIEGFTMWRAGGPLFPVIVIWGLLAATRLARGDEDNGHDELILGGVLSRRALLLSSLAALTIVVGVFALLAALLLPAIAEISPAGSLRYAVGMSLGFAFSAAFGTLLVQLATSRSSALRIGLGTLGITFALRVVTTIESTPEWLTWLTPFGWFAEIGTPEVGNTLPLLLYALGALILATGAVVLVGYREIHGSLLLGTDESAFQTRPYDSLWMHEIRQRVPSVVAFGGIAFAFSLVFGTVATDFVTFVEDFPGFQRLLMDLGLTDPSNPAAYVGLILSLLILIVTLYAAGHVAGIREDEAFGRLTVMLVLPLDRRRWAAMTTLIGIGGVFIVGAMIGAGALAGTAISGEIIAVPDALMASLNTMPIAILTIGFGMLVFGLYPALTASLTYGVMLTTYLLVLMDGFLDMPSWVVKISPFNYLAAVPGEPMNLTANLVFMFLGLAFAVTGTLLFRNRDIHMN